MRADLRRRRHGADARARAARIELRRRDRAIERLVARDAPPQFVFVPNRFNLSEIVAAYDLAARLGCSAFVTAR